MVASCGFSSDPKYNDSDMVVFGRLQYCLKKDLVLGISFIFIPRYFMYYSLSGVVVGGEDNSSRKTEANTRGGEEIKVVKQNKDFVKLR